MSLGSVCWRQDGLQLPVWHCSVPACHAKSRLLWGQDSSCTLLAHHELESIIIIVIMISIVLSSVLLLLLLSLLLLLLLVVVVAVLLYYYYTTLHDFCCYYDYYFYCAKSRRTMTLSCLAINADMTNVCSHRLAGIIWRAWQTSAAQVRMPCVTD